jgi:hypothetical protein
LDFFGRALLCIFGLGLVLFGGGCALAYGSALIATLWGQANAGLYSIPPFLGYLVLFLSGCLLIYLAFEKR